MATVRKYRPYTWDNYSLGTSAAGVITGTGTAIATGDCRQIAWETTYPGTAPGTGTLIIESSPNNDYTGTWTQLDSIDCSLLSGGTVGTGTYPGPVEFVRGRLSVNTNQGIQVRINGLLG